MIITVLGGIGSGKSLSLCREIVLSPNHPITNFRMIKYDYTRLRFDNIIKQEIATKENPKPKPRVNWEYWEKLKKENKHFSIYLDEAGNFINSRSSMTVRNRLLSKWISQIRKILSDSKHNHLWICSQKARQIDINFRELTQVVIECRKHKIKDKILIRQKYYEGFDDYDIGRAKGAGHFFGNKYFKYYDTEEMVRFSDAEEYV